MELKLGAGQVVNSVMDLLIVPYGIETVQTIWLRSIIIMLLIVPYGIETLISKEDRDVYQSFNRTLWN